jgi:hypothetical protein
VLFKQLLVATLLLHQEPGGYAGRLVPVLAGKDHYGVMRGGDGSLQRDEPGGQPVEQILLGLDGVEVIAELCVEAGERHVWFRAAGCFPLHFFPFPFLPALPFHLPHAAVTEDGRAGYGAGMSTETLLWMLGAGFLGAWATDGVALLVRMALKGTAQPDRINRALRSVYYYGGMFTMAAIWYVAQS